MLQGWSPFDISRQGPWVVCQVALGGADGHSRPIGTAPAGRVQRWARVTHGRTRMIVFPLIRFVGLRAATASSRVETLPMVVRSLPVRTRWAVSLSWALLAWTSKKTTGRRLGRT